MRGISMVIFGWGAVYRITLQKILKSKELIKDGWTDGIKFQILEYKLFNKKYN